MVRKPLINEYNDNKLLENDENSYKPLNLRKKKWL